MFDFGFGGGIVGLIGVLLFIWVVFDVFTKQKRMKDLHKILWILGSFVFAIIVPIIYFFVVKNGKF